MKQLFILITVVVVMSCDSNTQKSLHSAFDDDEYIAPQFPAEYKVEITHLNDDVVCGRSFSMHLCDSVVMLRMRNADNNNVFQLFSLPDGKFRGSFANYGRAENELLSYNLTTIDREQGVMYAADNNKYIVIDLRESFTRRKMVIKHSSSLWGRSNAIAMEYRGGRMLLSQGWGPRFFTTDEFFTDTVALYDLRPYVSPEFEADTILNKTYFAQNIRITVRPNGRRLATATRFGMLMEIFEVETDTMERIALRRFYKPSMENGGNYGTDDCIWGASGICSTNKYIYILYYDVPIDEIDISKRVLGVFDWAGDEVCKYEFDENITNFIVTPDDKRVYCWARDNESNEFLGYFDLK